MARFPERETDIAKMADDMIQGLLNNPAIYPDPPVTPAELSSALFAFIGGHDAAVAAKALAEQATTDKNGLLETLTYLVKQNLRYCENTVNYDDDKLKLVGSSGRKPPTPLQAPGQTRALHITSEGPGRISLDWLAPSEGGEPSAYNIERRPVGEEEWTGAGMAVITEATLLTQPRGQSLEYQVIAVNKAGTGLPSNSVTVVL